MKLALPSIQHRISRLRVATVALLGLAAGICWAEGNKDRSAITTEDRQFWSFRPVERPVVPWANHRWVRSPIDGFILKGLRDAGREPATETSKALWLRRVTYDLIGLPPTPAEGIAFESDGQVEAYERVVDRLLSSPRYGERQASQWLDGVRYLEEVGFYNFGDLGWRYRDWVIRAFNADMPYDRFVIHQIAGDLLPSLGGDGIIATGMLCMGNYDDQESDKEKLYAEVVDDQIDVVTRQFLGLTVACARCHDHKFDPIPTRDYYAMAGVFMSTRILTTDNKNGAERLKIPIPGEKAVAMAVREGGYSNSRHKEIGDMPIYKRGNPASLGEVVPRGVLQVIAGNHSQSIGERTKASGRMELAQWIGDPSNPLTARVMVNRLWQGHFGHGIVRTPSNFGALGERPSHPALLDWLAAEFTESGWSLKKLHRQMVLSATYRQQSNAAVSSEKDPENYLFARYERRRLTAEQVHDSLLYVSGRLRVDTQLGETARAVFTHTGQLKPWRFGQVFDAPPTGTMLATRNESTSAPQALYLLNDPAAIAAARGLGEISANSEIERIAWVYLAVYGRPCTALEKEKAIAYLKTIDKPWIFYQALLCSNEFLHIE